MESQQHVRSRLTIVARLVLMAAIGVASVALVGAASSWASENQSDATDRIAAISDGMSSQWNADMMHDGLRADVMSALFATTAAQREALAVSEVTEHATTLVTKYDAAATAAPTALGDDYTRVRPAVVAYGKTAEGLVALAATDHAAAEAELPNFLKAFGTLEEELGAIDDAMLTAVQDAGREGTETGRTSGWLILVAGLAGALLTAAAALFTVRAVRRPLRQMVAALRAAAGRDLTVEVEVVRPDELGEMAVALNEALSAIRTTVAATAASVGTLTAASSDLRDLAGRLDSSAEQTSAQARSADTAAQQVSHSVTDMMTATEELSASIREISQQTTTAATTTAAAGENAAATTALVATLSEASREIGTIVQLITSIAEQTNLLALNATIEAARAGDAGKGFAVVASEVKDLAQETAQATSDITGRIAAIQDMTSRTATAIDAIAEVITRIDDGQRTIAAAVEEQSTTTELMARNVGDMSIAATEISGTVTHITTSTGATADGANTTRRSAERVSTAAGEIQVLIGQFTY
ncbi:methyl-accepting chemotaxis protein [Actinoplanes friuliensis]|uniref:Methyl-accepting chemotaxis protein mcpB n=1 Tax=Actinoplanes friuliensis DSM 7358 TaxID=1246995 RepID=U5VW82_9ACTN|nr:methyl-accepting chemotaxis protein [Actinoplanes friuliensis]AGZ39921.1 Methyl-accepting chemotaxis protein mcpB [Actinoplanes friuliensis DSM 7358]